jgi:hypothetical protein
MEISDMRLTVPGGGVTLTTVGGPGMAAGAPATANPRRSLTRQYVTNRMDAR